MLTLRVLRGYFFISDASNLLLLAAAGGGVAGSEASAPLADLEACWSIICCVLVVLMSRPSSIERINQLFW
jgi:hypothetical protein